MASQFLFLTYNPMSGGLTDVEVVGVPDVHTSNTNTTIVLHALDALIQDLARVGLQASRKLNGMQPCFRILASDTLQCNVRANTIAHLLKLGDDSFGALELREIHGLNLGVLLLDVVQPPVLVDEDDSARAVDEREVRAHLSNWSCAPDGHDIAFLDASVDDAVPAGADDVGQEQAFLIRHIVGQLEEVDITVWDTSILGLAAGETASEMAVPEHACRASTVHGVLDCVGVGLFTLG